MSPWASAAFITVVLAAVSLASLDSYLLFHSLAELFFVLVAVAVFVVAWLLRDFLDDDFPLFLGFALVATGLLRVVHMLDYKGMSVLESSDPDQATQLWVATALLLSISFLVAPAVIGRRLHLPLTVGMFLLIDTLLVFSIYWWDIFPRAYVVGSGLTTTKKVAEYVICIIYALAIVTLVRRRAALRPAAVRLLVVAFALSVAAELFFTLYVGVYSWPNQVGHLLSLLAAYLIFKAVAEASLAQPHALAVENLRLGERAARAAQERAESVRREFDELLALTPTFHVEVGYEQTAWAVCRGARRTFECQSATLFAIDGNEIVVEMREPRATLMQPGVRFDTSDDVELRRLVKSRLPSFLPDAEEHPLLPLGVDRRISRRAESALRVPIGVGPAAERVLILIWGEVRQPPDPMMLALVQRFADHAGAALALAARRDLQEETRSLYERLESSLMPAHRIEHPRLGIVTRYRSGEHGMRIGGDFVGVLEHDDGRVSVVVGDVSGHGPDAAALGAMLRASWRSLSLADVGWQTMLDTLAEVLARERTDSEALVTLCAAVIDVAAGRAEIVNVGHPPPLLFRGSGGIEIVDVAPQPPLGAFEGTVCAPVALALPPDFKLLLYSDGLIEARAAPGASERLGVEGLVGLVGEHCSTSCDDAALDAVIAAAESAGGQPFADDVAVVLVWARGDGG